MKSKQTGSTYEITTDQELITIRLQRQLVDANDLAKLLDYLELEALQRKSQLQSSEAETLDKSVKDSAWRQVEHLFRGE